MFTQSLLILNEIVRGGSKKPSDCHPDQERLGQDNGSIIFGEILEIPVTVLSSGKFTEAKIQSEFQIS